MPKILVVDDEEDILFLVKQCLEKTGGYEVVVTTLPEEVVELCKKEKPDLVILDNVMPHMTGEELVKALHEDPETRKLLLIVASGQGEMVYFRKRDKWEWQPNRPVVQERGDIIKERNAERASQAYGVDDFLCKPFSPDALLSVVKEVLARHSCLDNEEAE